MIYNNHVTPLSHQSNREKSEAFCPSNIALCKYWGKRSETLNLPNNSSLSISLGKLGTRASVCLGVSDMLVMNGKRANAGSSAYKRLFTWIDALMGKQRPHLYIHTFSNIPTGAGVASSASSFGAILKSLNHFFDWQLHNSQLSHFARLGSGSAARSLLRGFVYARAGKSPDGADFDVVSLPDKWSEFRIAILYIDRSAKSVSSRDGMNMTTQGSPIYQGWVDYAERACDDMIGAIKDRNFTQLGEIAERNALMMHGTMMGCNPPLIYMLPDTLKTIQHVQKLRVQEGIEIYTTMDAGPNVKLLFLAQQTKNVKALFPQSEIIAPFDFAF